MLLNSDFLIPNNTLVGIYIVRIRNASFTFMKKQRDVFSQNNYMIVVKAGYNQHTDLLSVLYSIVCSFIYKRN